MFRLKLLTNINNYQHFTMVKIFMGLDLRKNGLNLSFAERVFKENISNILFKVGTLLILKWDLKLLPHLAKNRWSFSYYSLRRVISYGEWWTGEHVHGICNLEHMKVFLGTGDEEVRMDRGLMVTQCWS